MPRSRISSVTNLRSLIIPTMDLFRRYVNRLFASCFVKMNIADWDRGLVLVMLNLIRSSELLSGRYCDICGRL
jgi:hypothetical protein